MYRKKFVGGCFTLLASVVLLTACNGAEADTSASATITAFETEVAALESENQELTAENQELGTAVDEVTTFLGIGEPTATAVDVSGSVPNAFIGDGEKTSYGDWEIQFVDYSVVKEVVDTSDEYTSSWEADDMYHTVLLEVENMSQQSQEFPFTEFSMVEEYGALYAGTNLLGDYPPTDRSRMRIPGNKYEILLAFDIPEEANVVQLVSDDGSMVLDLASVDPAATPVPDSVSILGDGTVVEYADWQISFDSLRQWGGSSGEEYYDLRVTVVNIGEERREFPYREFAMVESNGSISYALSLRLQSEDYPYNDAENENLVPNKEYKLELTFSVDNREEVEIIKTLDSSLLIRLED